MAARRTSGISTANATIALGSISFSGLSIGNYRHLKIRVATAGTAGVRVLGWDLDFLASGMKVHRIGHSGSTAAFHAAVSAGALYAFQLQALNPSVVFISLGVNDMNNGATLAQYQTDFATLIGNVQAALPNAQVVIYTQAESGHTLTTLSTYAAQIQAYCASAGLPYIDVYTNMGAYSANKWAYWNGSQHPVTTGGAVIAQMLRGFLARGMNFAYGDNLTGNNSYNTANPPLSLWQMLPNGILAQGSNYTVIDATGLFKLQLNTGIFMQGSFSMGNWLMMNPGAAGGIGLGSGHKIMWSSSNTNTGDSSGVGVYGDVGLMRSAAGVLEINNGTAGITRDISARTVRTPAVAVSALVAAATAGAGARAFVTDATATTFMTTVAGGGSSKVPVVSDGTNWLVG